MRVQFKIDYKTTYGQIVCISGNLPELGAWDKEKAMMLNCSDSSRWCGAFEVREADSIEYCYMLKEGNRIIRKEWGDTRKIKLDLSKDFYFTDSWHDVPHQKFLYTSAFFDSFFKQDNYKTVLRYFKESILLTVSCPFVGKNQKVILSGESDYLGNWNSHKSLSLQETGYGKWAIILNVQKIKQPLQYKFAILDKETENILHWEEGNNRIIAPVKKEWKGDKVQVFDLNYHRDWMNWKTSGVAIPVFSLRSNDSFGCGEFSDLKKMIDWAKMTGMKMIQILPVNDTTITRKWTDSYPYNAISIYALHPVYLGLNGFPLKNEKKLKAYKKKASELNALTAMNYEQTFMLKEAYLRDLFNERGKATLQSKEFKDFFENNEIWLFPYACFTYYRDRYQTADHSTWGTSSRYNKTELEKVIEEDADMKYNIQLVYFTQYLLHIQLSDVKEYAHENEVVLKGDIPIGISRNSVEAWVEPYLFNLDTQTGAPPDDFSVFGQNWGFPTYNWGEMSKDGYQWWIKRFRKMADYFDAYRIDHILGFFRIWEIPLHSVQGLLGYFSPALPFTAEEIDGWGLWLDEQRMTQPYIHEHFLENFFGGYTQEVIEAYLNPISWQLYELKEFCNTQVKIKAFFDGKTDEKSNCLRDGLYSLCNEVLFVRDKREPNKFHPRITAQYTYSYKDLDNSSKEVYNRLYNHFFYERHNRFWGDQAMKKLPTLISSTNMLVCGEDLGMIPFCVPSVMKELQILSLEIQRMPKDSHKQFEDLNTIPYLSVCTTSTHDMSPIRAWWLEDRDVTQQYYNEVLWKQGPAPEECIPELCGQIVMNHLNSPAMLSILPLQDWLSIDGKLRRENPYEERINIPAVAQHYWQYRMHLTLEDLLKADELNHKIKEMLNSSER